MKLAEVDWGYVRRHTLRPAASAIVALAVLGACWVFQDRQRSLHTDYSVNQLSIHKEYDALIYGRRLIERYHRRYGEFRAAGFVGLERRVDWVETIRVAATGLNLPSVSYSIEPQVPAIVPVNSGQNGADVQTKLSRLRMNLGLVHEGDLLRFFTRLDSEAPGLMKVDRCSLVRQSNAQQELTAGTNLIADCSLTMFSVITSDTGSGDAEI